TILWKVVAGGKVNVWLVKPLAIDEYAALGDQDGLALQTDDALDVIGVRLRRCAEDRHIAALRTAKDVAGGPLMGGRQNPGQGGALDVEVRGAVNDERLPTREGRLHADAL